MSTTRCPDSLPSSSINVVPRLFPPLPAFALRTCTRTIFFDFSFSFVVHIYRIATMAPHYWLLFFAVGLLVNRSSAAPPNYDQSINDDGPSTITNIGSNDVEIRENYRIVVYDNLTTGIRALTPPSNGTVKRDTTAIPASYETPADAVPASTSTAQAADTVPASTFTAQAVDTVPASTLTAQAVDAVPASTTTTQAAEAVPASTPTAPEDAIPAGTLTASAPVACTYNHSEFDTIAEINKELELIGFNYAFFCDYTKQYAGWNMQRFCDVWTAMHENTGTGGAAQETITAGTAQETIPAGTAQETITAGTAQETITPGTAQETTVGAAQETTVGAAQETTVGAAQETVTAGTAQETVTAGATQETATGVAQETVAVSTQKSPTNAEDTPAGTQVSLTDAEGAQSGGVQGQQAVANETAAERVLQKNQDYLNIGGIDVPSFRGMFFKSYPDWASTRPQSSGTAVQTPGVPQVNVH